MIRYLLLAVILFMAWKMIQIFNRMGGLRRQRRDLVNEEGTSPRPSEEFRDIKDASFEELPPEKKPKP